MYLEVDREYKYFGEYKRKQVEKVHESFTIRYIGLFLLF